MDASTIEAAPGAPTWTPSLTSTTSGHRAGLADRIGWVEPEDIGNAIICLSSDEAPASLA